MLREICHSVKYAPYVIFRLKYGNKLYAILTDMEIFIVFFLFSSSVLCWGVWETCCPPARWKNWALKWATFVSWSLCVHFFRPTCRPSRPWPERVPGSSTTSQVLTLLRWFWLLNCVNFLCMYSLCYLAQGQSGFRDSSYQQTLWRLWTQKKKHYCTLDHCWYISQTAVKFSLDSVLATGHLCISCWTKLNHCLFK